MRASIIIVIGFLVACSDDTAIDAGADARSDAPAADARALADAIEDVGSSEQDAGDSSIAIGLGVVDFSVTSDGDDAELVAGPQGGWHVDVALRLFNLEPDGALLTLQGFDADSGDALTVPIARRLTRSRVRRVDDHWLRLGDQMVFDVDDPAEVTDREVRLTATIAEADGRETSGALRVHIIDDLE
ncbi:MAG: hypothetical protein ACI9KE_000829 [Polyangiales bacterium]